MGFWIRRAALVAIALAGLVYLVLLVRELLASNETRIRWLLDDAVEAFHDEDLSDCLAPLELDWQETRSGATIEDLEQALQYGFLYERDPETKRFAWRLEILAETIAVTFRDRDERRADLSFAARVLRRRGEAEELVWEARCESYLVRQGRYWSIASTEAVGSLPRRRRPRKSAVSFRGPAVRPVSR